MTPHPLATWTQMTISPQRQVVRRRRRRIVAHLLASSLAGGSDPAGQTGAPRIPAQRMPTHETVTHA